MLEFVEIFKMLSMIIHYNLNLVEEEEFFNSLMLCSTMEVGVFGFWFLNIEIEEILMMGF